MTKNSRDRISVDLRDLREKVESLQQSDPKLAAMKLSQVVRYLVEVGVRVESGEERRADKVLRSTLLKIFDEPVPDHELTEAAYDADVPVELLRQFQECLSNQRRQNRVHKG